MTAMRRSRVLPYWLNWRGVLCSVLIICTIGLWGCQPQATPSGFLTKVDQVYSGQSLSVLDPLPVDAEDKVYKIRLAGIDAPDLKQAPWGEVAKAALWTWVNDSCRDRTLSIELPSQATPDAYGRVWAYVWCDGQLANEQLVFNGHAIAQLDAIDDRNLTYQAQLSRAQDHARLAGLGIWNPAQPMRSTPAEFRQQ